MGALTAAGALKGNAEDMNLNLDLSAAGATAKVAGNVKMPKQQPIAFDLAITANHPEFTDLMKIADMPASGAKGGNPQHITIVDRAHPITQGVEDFDITDESYLCPMFEDSVHCIMRSNFHPTAAEFANRGPAIASHPPGSNMTGWVKTAERSPIAYIQHGHDNTAWSNPNWHKLVLNAIKWTASSESKTLAHANAKRIFK